jgi:4-diphosphocytidyl-2-C-methyl-D-erythritol kinase
MPTPCNAISPIPHCCETAKVKLIKRIPNQAGLGGGSSDASAVLLAACKAWKPSIPLQELSDLSAEIGSDCPPLRSSSLHNGKIRNIDNLLSALRSGSLEDIGSNFFNFLEFPAEKLWNNFTTVKERLEKAGCIAVRMTGSGTAFYGLSRNGEDAEDIAEQLRKTLRNGEAVFAVRSL